MKHRKLVKESPNTVKMWWKTGRLNDVKITSDQRVDIGNSMQNISSIEQRKLGQNRLTRFERHREAKKKWKDKK